MGTSKLGSERPRRAGETGGVRERVLQAIGAQLRETAGQALTSALEALEGHEPSKGAMRSQASGGRQASQRMRELLERDRALASAEAAAPVFAPAPKAPAAPAAPASKPAVTAVDCDEPIRTRSMAKLLAAQGYFERALSIYAYLLAQDAGNAALIAEADALREAQARAASSSPLPA
jgi:hypothetical protein